MIRSHSRIPHLEAGDWLADGEGYRQLPLTDLQV
jgi:hypothetical protein